MDSDTYLTVKAFSQSLYKEKGSRFIGLAYAVTTKEEIKGILETIRKEHHSARHQCFAWTLGAARQTYRINDDGEPSGTAGRPILGQINSFGLTDILIVVVRYFGGRLLGTTGLINAYRSAAELSIINNEIIRLYVYDCLELIFPFSSLNNVMRMIKDENLIQSHHSYGLECRLTLSFRSSAKEKIIKGLSVINGLEYKQINIIEIP